MIRFSSHTMDHHQNSPVSPPNAHGKPDDENPACQSCRRRKLKCCRAQPSCSQCSRLELECVYTSRQKPGLKSGAVESLSRRVEALENILRKNVNTTQLGPADFDAQQSFFKISTMLVKELERIQFSSNSTFSSNYSPINPSTANTNNVPKRKRQDSPELIEISSQNGPESDNMFCSLPSRAVIDSAIEIYFRKVHPWIPFLHESRFMNRLATDEKSSELAILIHAIVCATLKFIPHSILGPSELAIDSQIELSRQNVLLGAMERPSVINLQSLVIISFDYIGGGQVEKAWSLIGSLTRTVEYLRLTVEPDEASRQSLQNPLSLLDPANSWTEIEERRRLFWNIFLLDRFCSVTTGWSTSLTSDDVHRKLPCDGGLWAREERSDTPYFGIWNKSAARIGNSVAYIPAHYPTPDQDEHDNLRSPGAILGPSLVDTSKLGAFAYCIEATESLSQVTTFFLQQRVDFKNRQEVGVWLTRFKELDLRLVHWKMFLPQKWKDSNISRDITLIDMDPNLTLAHITHNTSMILLHQHIGFPSPDWSNTVKLPSSCSAETCLVAAVETAAITQKYLKYKPADIVSNQFVTCAFVAGRTLLIYWRFCNTDLPSEFFGIVESLKEMSTRWQGIEHQQSEHKIQNLPAKYASHLETLQSALLKTPRLCFDILGYSSSRQNSQFEGLLPPLDSSRKSSVTLRSSLKVRKKSPVVFNNHESAICPSLLPENTSSDFRNTPSVSFHQRLGHDSRISSSNAAQTWDPISASSGLDAGLSHIKQTQNGTEDTSSFGSPSVDDELTAMSNVLLGQQFMEMDRVITFDGTNFVTNLDNWQSLD